MEQNFCNDTDLLVDGHRKYFGMPGGIQVPDNRQLDSVGGVVRRFHIASHGSGRVHYQPDEATACNVVGKVRIWSDGGCLSASLRLNFQQGRAIRRGSEPRIDALAHGWDSIWGGTSGRGRLSNISSGRRRAE